MSPQTFCIITPSYAPDFEKCRALSQSISDFLPPQVTHYIVVDKQDYPLFKVLEKFNTRVILKEVILPQWIWRVPLIQKNIWLSWKTPPTRGWIIQQVIKIAIAHHLQEEILVYVDSDTVFVKKFSLENIVQNGQVRLYCNRGANPASMKRHLTWHQTAAKILRLPPPPMPAPDFIGSIITWRRENVLKLCQHLEAESGKSWAEVLLNQLNLSEYILYGTFVDQVLKDKSGHYIDAQDICLSYWTPAELSDEQIRKFLSQLQPHHRAVMITARSGISVERYENLLKQISGYTDELS